MIPNPEADDSESPKPMIPNPEADDSESPKPMIPNPEADDYEPRGANQLSPALQRWVAFES